MGWKPTPHVTIPAPGSPEQPASGPFERSSGRFGLRVGSLLGGGAELVVSQLLWSFGTLRWVSPASVFLNFSFKAKHKGWEFASRVLTARCPADSADSVDH